MNTPSNIFEELDKDSDSEEFFEVIKNPARKTEFASVVSHSEPSGKNIFESLNEQQKQEKDFSFLETLQDVGEQVLSKGVSGAVGAYGNILDTFGLQLNEGETLPGQKARNSAQFAVLEKLDRGEVPSFGEFMLLSDDDVAPNFTRFPTSKNIQEKIENVTGIGEGKTPEGRIAGRGAEFISEGAATGGGAKALIGLGLSGLAGQGIRESGGGEGLASTVEIGGSLAPSVISKKLIPTGKGTKDIVEAGRKVGLSESQITPLIQGEKKAATLSKVARKGSKTKELFNSIKESLGDSYQNIKNSVSNIGNVNAANQKVLIDKFTIIKDDLQKTLKASPDKEAAINFITDAIKKVLKKGASPEELINFWQDINKSVKWNSIQGGKKSLTKLKEPILEVLNNVAPQAAKDFELTNSLYSRYSQISKRLKPDIVDSILNKGEILAAPAAGIALVQGNPWALIGLGSESAIRLLGREMLINPYFQNISKKMVRNFNQGSIRAVTESVNQVKDYMRRKHPNEDWSFLTED